MGRQILAATDLSVVKSGKRLVHVERFAVEPGEIHVLLGPNGAGKTTLLRALNGLERADGTLEFDGRPVRTRKDTLRLRRHTAAVFQQAYLLSTSVRGNVESALKLRRVKGAELAQRVDRALELLSITHLANRRRQGLSGGEAQRVSVARAVATDPAVLFLDEPMASLDPPTRRALMVDLQRIFEQLSMAVLWVTHDTIEARNIADRITFLADGAVVQSGTCDEVFEHPLTATVAEYLYADLDRPQNGR